MSLSANWPGQGPSRGRRRWVSGSFHNRAFLRQGGAPVRHLSRVKTRASLRSARWLVQEEPVEPDLRHGSRERLEGHPLYQVAVCAQAISCRRVGALAGRGGEDDGG